MSALDLAEAAPSAAHLDALFARARTAWRPPPRLHLSTWADQHYILTPESGAAEPGRWKTLPYQRGIMDAMSDPRVEHLAVIKSARIGWTEMLKAYLAMSMHQDPCAVMVVMPAVEDAQGFSKQDLAPLLRDCRALAGLVADAKAKDSDNTMLLKQFRGGGSITLVGANSPRGFRRVSRKKVLFDEIDAYPASAGTEGDPIKLATRRSDYFWDRKLLYGSTPGQAGLSRIEALFEAGDQRRYHVPCIHCGTRQVLVFDHFKWPNRRPEAAVYVCAECGAEIEHRHKRDMVHAGTWVAAAPFHGFASFHIWAAYSFSPKATWGQICREYVDAEQKPEELKVFVNTVRGETWKDKADAPDWQRLYQRREHYPRLAAPRGVLFLTAGVDVQRHSLIYEVVGWGREKRSWSIDIGELPGDTSAPTNPVWLQIDALLARSFVAASGIAMHIAMLAVDSGDQTQTVYNWARRHPMSRVIAVKGVDTTSVLISSPRPVDVSVDGRLLKRGYKYWPVAVSVAKAELYGWLNLEPPTVEAQRDEGAQYPPGYCHHPEYGEDFFKSLTGERLVIHRGRSQWEKIPGRVNHHLDVRLYGRAAASVVGLDRFTESDWAALEAAAGYEPMLPPASVPLPDVPVSGPVDPQGELPWIPQITNDWLTKGR